MRAISPIRVLMAMAMAIPLVCVSADMEESVAAAEEGIPGADEAAVEVPPDLLEDEHFRGEMGINAMTTPSIRLIFDQLEELGTVPFDEVWRAPQRPTAADRVGVALRLGMLVADGFLLVQEERYSEMEGLGKAILEHTDLLGTGTRLQRHSKALLEQAALQNREGLRQQLVETQRDVEREMADLRDADIAHLISLGGWLRALQIGGAAVAGNFSSESVRKLARVDITAYYQAQLVGLHPRLQERPVISGLRLGLARLQDLLDKPAGLDFTEDDLAAIRRQADLLLELIAAQ